MKYTIWIYAIIYILFMFLFISLEAHTNHEMQDLTFNKASRFI